MLYEKSLPTSNLLQRIWICDIKHEDHTMRILQICRNQTTVSLLPSRIPHLKSENLPISIKILDIKIDSDSCLNREESTL